MFYLIKETNFLPKLAFQMEVKVYKQKVKHLLYEQENHLAELKAESMVINTFFIFQCETRGQCYKNTRVNYHGNFNPTFSRVKMA
jgi:hypothetical protein